VRINLKIVPKFKSKSREIKMLLPLIAIVAVVAFGRSSALILDCTYGDSSFDIADIYTCSARLLHTGEEEIILYVAGRHWDNYTLDDVRGLEIRNEFIEKIPVNIHQFFPNLLVLEISGSSINEVTYERLAPHPNLVLLALQGNAISEIDGNVFRDLTNLQLVNLSQNQLLHVGFELLDSLVNLQLIFMNDNPCIDQNATSGTLSDLNYRLTVTCPATLRQIEKGLIQRGNLVNGNGSDDVDAIAELNEVVVTLFDQVLHLKGESKIS